MEATNIGGKGGGSLNLPLKLLKEMSKTGEKNSFQEFSMGARDIAHR